MSISCAQQTFLCQQAFACAQQTFHCRQALACAQQTFLCQQALVCAEQEPSICQQALAYAQQEPSICQQVLACAQQTPPFCQQMLACAQEAGIQTRCFSWLSDMFSPSDSSNSTRVKCSKIRQLLIVENHFYCQAICSNNSCRQNLWDKWCIQPPTADCYFHQTKRHHSIIRFGGSTTYSNQSSNIPVDCWPIFESRWGSICSADHIFLSFWWVGSMRKWNLLSSWCKRGKQLQATLMLPFLLHLNETVINISKNVQRAVKIGIKGFAFTSNATTKTLATAIKSSSSS